MSLLSAAASSSAASACICRRDFASPPRERNAFAFPRRFRIASADDAASSSSVETASSLDGDDNTVVEAPKGPPSLISTLNVERALRGIPITDVDHYGRLGLSRRCSYDQVYVAYEKMVEELMGKGLDEEELNQKLELLKESYSILSNPEERRLYDWSLVRSEKPDRYAWPFEADITKKTPDSPQQDPEDVGPTRAVGYFMLGWLLLSFALSIALNR